MSLTISLKKDNLSKQGEAQEIPSLDVFLAVAALVAHRNSTRPRVSD